MAESFNQVGKYFKSQIEKAGITQKQITKRSGVGDKTVDVFFNDRGNISPKNLEAILDAINEETSSTKPKVDKIESSFILTQIERIVKGLPEDLQLVAYEQLKALELHNYQRHMRR